MDVLIATSRSYLAVAPQWSAQHLSDGDIASYWQLPLYYHPPAVIYGVVTPQPRDVGFFSDESEGYYYSGQMMPSQPQTEPLDRLIAKVNGYLGTTFNAELVNRYMDGNDKLGAHSDSEVGLDKHKKCVAGIAFGAVRNFRIRYIKTCPPDIVISSTVDRRASDSTIIADVPHQDGMLLVMAGDFQTEFTHEIPPIAVSKVSTPRLSLTFRHHTQ